MVLPAVKALGHWEGEVLFRGRREGGPVHVLQSLFIVRDAESRTPLCIANVARDMTVRKRAEEALKRTESHLLQTQRMESIGKLAGGIAHDFNNLLTAINGYAELSLALVDRPGQLHDNLSEIRGAGERAASLTRQLLAYSRKQVMAPRNLDVNAIVASMQNMLARIIGEDLVLSVSTHPGTATVKADPGQIEQVILNLVVNARDATPGGGQITIETRQVELDEAAVVVHPEILPGKYVLLAVTDTGTGMDPEVKARIFEPFFTTKEFGKGSGMGLSMVQGIVDQSGGYIYAYSEPGHGSTFKVYLPAVGADEPAEPASSPFPCALGDYRGKETILLAEDEEAVRKLTRGLLEMQGYTVLEAQDGLEGERLGLTYPGSIALLLTDVIMPKRNGRELAARIQEARPGTRVIFMSGYTDDAIVRHGFIDKETRFLQKPFTPDKLVRTVREVLNVPAVPTAVRIPSLPAAETGAAPGA
jgi:signal transduction histidine kinase/ActR/RegA family two-component response regulator